MLEEIELTVGQEQTINLQSSSGGGFLWYPSMEPEDTIQISKSHQLSKGIGGGVTQSFTIKAVSIGSVRLIFEHRRAFGNQTLEKREYYVTVK